MFEIIDMEGGTLRFDDKYFYEIHGDHVKVFSEINNDVKLVTTVFHPVRIDKVDINSVLAARRLTLAPHVFCKYCGKEN